MMAFARVGALIPADGTVNPDDQQQLISGALPIAGLFVLVLGIAIFILWRSLTKQLKKIDKDLPQGEDDRQQARDRRYTQEAIRRGEQDEPGDPTPDATTGTPGS